MCEELLLLVASSVIASLPAIAEQVSEWFERAKEEVERFIPTKF